MITYCYPQRHLAESGNQLKKATAAVEKSLKLEANDIYFSNKL